jgi:hypothetical protein
MLVEHRWPRGKLTIRRDATIDVAVHVVDAQAVLMGSAGSVE